MSTSESPEKRDTPLDAESDEAQEHALAAYPVLTLAMVDDLTAQAVQAGGIISSIVAVITPEVAQQLLDNRNRDNFRNPSPAQITKYQKYMDAGDWSPGASMILFSREGCTEDGQQRLSAVSKSGKPQVFVFSFGHDEDVKLRVDHGLSRTAAQTMAYAIGLERGRDEEGLPRLASGVPNAWRLYRGLNPALPSGSLPPGEDLLRAWQSPNNATFREWFEHAAAFVADKASETGTQSAVLIAFYVYLIDRRCQPADIEEFIKGLSGILVGESDARRKCRLYLKGHVTTGRGGEALAIRVSFYTWNRWMDGDVVHAFNPPREGGIPGRIATQRKAFIQAEPEASAVADPEAPVVPEAEPEAVAPEVPVAAPEAPVVTTVTPEAEPEAGVVAAPEPAPPAGPAAVPPVNWQSPAASPQQAEGAASKGRRSSSRAGSAGAPGAATSAVTARRPPRSSTPRIHGTQIPGGASVTLASGAKEG